MYFRTRVQLPAPPPTFARLNSERATAGKPQLANPPRAKVVRRSAQREGGLLQLNTLTALIQRERVQRVADGNEHVLLAVHRIRLRRVGDRADSRMPQRLAVRRVIRDEVAAAVPAEDQLAG